MIVTTSSAARMNRKLLVRLARDYRLPAVYPYSYYVAEGGLCSFGVDEAAAYRGAAAYVSRILKGAKPSDLPVQEPTKYQLVLNQKSSREIGLSIPQAVLFRADKVVE